MKYDCISPTGTPTRTLIETFKDTSIYIIYRDTYMANNAVMDRTFALTQTPTWTIMPWPKPLPVKNRAIDWLNANVVDKFENGT